MPSSRLEAFSDGVFAIAITLLVIEVKVPHGTDDGLLRALANQWPSYAAYAVSFLTIGIIWVNHHVLFEHVTRSDRALLFLNLILLMFVAFIPFPTAVLAEYVREGGSNSHTAAILYGGTMTLLAVAFSSMWTYLSRRGLLGGSLSPQRARVWERRSWAGPAIYAAATLVALASAPVALIVFALVALVFVVPGGPDNESQNRKTGSVLAVSTSDTSKAPPRGCP